MSDSTQSRRNLRFPGTRRRRWRASIGPRSSDRGNASTDFRSQVIENASIGPRSSDRGNTSTVNTANGRSSSFNWAAILRSRKCAATEVEAAANFASIGPRSSDRGNGWRTPPVRNGHLASIGPRSSDRGNGMKSKYVGASNELQLGRDPQIAEITLSTIRALSSSGFNWAAILRSRK